MAWKKLSLVIFAQKDFLKLLISINILSNIKINLKIEFYQV
jgi:hypothetical protein